MLEVSPYVTTDCFLVFAGQKNQIQSSVRMPVTPARKVLFVLILNELIFNGIVNV